MKRVRVTRDVTEGDLHNYLGRDVAEGETFYQFAGATYGCVNTQYGIALSEEPGKNPFFEFPLDAVEELSE